MSELPVILYLHIPKAGGTTLGDWLFNQLRGPEIRIKETNKPYTGVYYYPSGYIKDPSSDANIKINAILRRNDLRGVFGHFHFGAHKLLNRPWAYITMLRHPVTRVVSLYNFQRLIESRIGAHEGVTLPSKTTLDDFVRNPPYIEVDNGQTRRIADQSGCEQRCSGKMLTQAKRNLREHFSVVGITERFDESLLLLARTFGWDSKLLYYPRNVTVAGTHSSRQPEKTIALIREKNAFDIELYEFAQQLLDKSIAAQGAAFDAELKKFRAAKESYFDQVGGWDMPAEFR